MILSTASNSYILYEKGYSAYHGEGVGLLSIKSFFGGQAFYEVGRNRYVVGEGAHLVLNHGQPYSIRIDADTPMESFCLFFAEGFAEDVRQCLTTSDEHILSDPFKPPTTPLLFFEKTYPHDTFLSPAILHLRTRIESGHATRGWLEEQFHQMMQRLLHVHENVYQEVEALPAARPATREELYRRLQGARDYATALFNTPLTLAELADVACLSPNHLLRTFKQLFGQTPHQFITSKRLEEAQRLLLRTERSVTEICFAVGFESLGTFSWLFRRRCGVSPTEFRRQKR
jgi:AraC family transcriptional regulator